MARHLDASVNQTLLNILDSQHWIDVPFPLCHDHEAAFAVHEAGQPRPIGVFCHGNRVYAIPITFNPDYADMARRRIEGDAPLLTEAKCA